MNLIDIVIILGYFIFVASISWWSSRKKQDDTQSYFLANREAGWITIGVALFASNISGEHFIGLAGSGAASGLAVGQFEWLACFILILLGWLFVPFYLKTGVFTMPEFLERRYNRGCRNYLSAVSLIAYIFTKISVCVYAGAIVLKTILGWNIWFGAIILVLATGIYTIIGGLRAVIYTELFQAFVLIFGAVVLTVLGVSAAGGIGSLTQTLPASFFSVWRSFDHADFPWTGILFGAPILGVWYWCTDQMIVQRTLAARNIDHAQRGTIFAGFLKILPVFILVLPGLAGRVLYPDVAPDQMYAKMVNTLLPVGIKGLVVASLLAAIMSSLSAVFNSSSTLAVVDFYKHYRPQATEKQLVSAGRIATAVLVVVGILWLPFIGIISDQLFVYLQSVQAYISPPIAAVFLIGLLWKRGNGHGALSALLVGFVIGAFRFVGELLTKSGATTFEPIIKLSQINFLHFAAILFIISIITHFIVSLATGAPLPEKLEIFSAGSGNPEFMRHDTAAYKIDVALSFILAGIIILFWIIFSPIFFK
jgi:SSS family solute:Na+ symporter